MSVNLRVLIVPLVVMCLGGINHANAEERICPDGKRSYFGVCPDEGNQSRPPSTTPSTPTPPQQKPKSIPGPLPVPAPVVDSNAKDCDQCPEMVVLPPGGFMMGSSPKEQIATAIPQHRVNIQSFSIGKYEVTQQQWSSVMGSNPSRSKGPNLPVENVTWDEAQQYVQRLSQKTGKQYRLPSEAEWEYAARAGSATPYPKGNSDSELSTYAWYSANATTTNPVGMKTSNQFGLYDMLGNVYEWTQDCWGANYSGAPADGTAWTIGRCSERVIRGGSWNNTSDYLRYAFRIKRSTTTRNFNIGFRVARTP